MNEMLAAGQRIPPSITAADIGCAIPTSPLQPDAGNVDEDVIDHQDGMGLVRVARILQRSSQRYWILEYMRRAKEKEPWKAYEALVLGCVDPQRKQYAIYIYELGFEHRYVNSIGTLRSGSRIWLRVASVSPRNDQLLWTRFN